MQSIINSIIEFLSKNIFFLIKSLIDFLIINISILYYFFIVISISLLIRYLPNEILIRFSRPISVVIKSLILVQDLKLYILSLLGFSFICALIMLPVSGPNYIVSFFILFFSVIYLIVLFSNPYYNALEILRDWPLKYMPIINKNRKLSNYYMIVFSPLPLSFIYIFLNEYHIIPFLIQVLISIYIGIFPTFFLTNIPQIFGEISRTTDSKTRKKLVISQMLYLPFITILAFGGISALSLALFENIILTPWQGILLILLLLLSSFSILYFLLIDIPFFIGQKRWKTSELSKITEKILSIQNELSKINEYQNNTNKKIEIINLQQQYLFFNFEKESIKKEVNHPYRSIILFFTFLITTFITFSIMRLFNLAFPI